MFFFVYKHNLHLRLDPEAPNVLGLIKHGIGLILLRVINSFLVGLGLCEK